MVLLLNSTLQWMAFVYTLDILICYMSLLFNYFNDQFLFLIPE